MMMSDLARLSLESEGDVELARVAGEVDASNVDDLSRRLLSSVSNKARGLVLDLTETSYIDSSGIELLFRLHAALAADGVELIVVAPDGSNAARLLGLVAMSDIGEVRRSLAEALHRCGS